MRDAPQEMRKPLLPYEATLVLTSIGMTAFLAATATAFYFGSPAVGILCLILAALNTARVVFLIRIGKKGWESRVRQGR
jgi:fatty acid desaturase